MFKKFWKRFKDFLTPLKSEGYEPNLEITRRERDMSAYSFISVSIGDSDEAVYRRNAQKLEIAKLAQEKDAINKNLKAQHRVMIATLAAVMVALLSSIVALIIALTSKPPVVNVQSPPTTQKH